MSHPGTKNAQTSCQRPLSWTIDKGFVIDGLSVVYDRRGTFQDNRTETIDGHYSGGSGCRVGRRDMDVSSPTKESSPVRKKCLKANLPPRPSPEQFARMTEAHRRVLRRRLLVQLC